MILCVASVPGCCSRVGRSARLIGWSPRNTRWSLSMVSTVRCSVISLTVFVLGTATSMPDCSTGAVSMKITSSTSTTSTSGVILISAREVCVCPLLLVKATCGLPFQWIFVFRDREFFHAVQQLAGEIIHARAELAAPRRELVVGNDSRNCDHKACRSCNQRLRYTRSHSPQRCRAGCAESVEGIDNTHDGSEKADKRGDCADGRQPR